MQLSNSISAMSPLERITERVSRHGDVNDQATPRPLLTLEEFFDGNDVDGSIWCNCSPPPTRAEARSILGRIRSRPEVADVRVEVSLFDAPEWPFSEVVYIITAAAPEQVKQWFPESVQPDEVWIGMREEYPNEPLAVPATMNAICCWWD
jgi:hypothetical protein